MSDDKPATRQAIAAIDSTRVAQVVMEQSRVFSDPGGSAEFILRVGRYQGGKFVSSSTPQVEKEWKRYREAILVADADASVAFTVDVSKHFLIPPGVGSERYRWRVIVQPRRDEEDVPLYSLVDALLAFAECIHVESVATTAVTVVDDIPLSAKPGRNLRQDSGGAGASSFSDDSKNNFRPTKPRR